MVHAGPPGTRCCDQFQHMRKTAGQFPVDMAVAGSAFGQVVIGSAAHAHKIIAPDVAAGIAFREEGPQEQGQIAQALQQQATLAVVAGCLGVAVQQGQRSLLQMAFVVVEQSVAAAKAVGQFAEVPQGVLVGWWSQAPCMARQAAPKIVGKGFSGRMSAFDDMAYPFSSLLNPVPWFRGSSPNQVGNIHRQIPSGYRSSPPRWK